jgi:GDPmannose 4,6-dehydratase
MKTILITGATGHIGSNLCRHYIDCGYDVIGLKRRTSLIATDRIDDLFKNRNFKLEYFDLTDSNSIWTTLIKYKPDFIANLGAQSHVRVSFDLTDSTVDVTAMGVLRLLDACRAICPNVRFYQASSSEIYGDTPPPQDEESKISPMSPYACAKAFGYHIVKNYRKAYGMFTSNGILFNTSGITRGETFVSRKITMAAAKIKYGLQNCLYLGNLDSRRDWLDVSDSVLAIDKILTFGNKADDFVIASGESHSVREFCELTFEYAGIGKIEWIGKGINETGIVNGKTLIKIDPKYFRPSEVSYLQGNPKKIKDLLGWERKVSFPGLVQKMVEYDLGCVR